MDTNLIIAVLLGIFLCRAAKGDDGEYGKMFWQFEHLAFYASTDSMPQSIQHIFRNLLYRQVFAKS